MNRVLSLLVAIVVTVVPACTSSPAGAEFDGKEFKVMAMTVDGQDVDMVKGHEPTMNFQEGRVSGNNGCNTYGGVALIGDGTFSIDQMSQTEMACIETDRIETAFNRAISTMATWERLGENTYLLASPDGATTMTLIGV
jgi:heat shock protein HslJ